MIIPNCYPQNGDKSTSFRIDNKISAFEEDLVTNKVTLLSCTYNFFFTYFLGSICHIDDVKMTNKGRFNIGNNNLNTVLVSTHSFVLYDFLGLV